MLFSKTQEAYQREVEEVFTQRFKENLEVRKMEIIAPDSSPLRERKKNAWEKNCLSEVKRSIFSALFSHLACLAAI